MNKVFTIILLSGFMAVPAVRAQKWEVGGGVGGSFFTSEGIKLAVSSADASLSNGIGGSVWLGNNSGRLLGGELRYDYERTDLKLTSSTQSASFGADTHSFHYDFLIHFAPSTARVRPYVSGGGGVKVYRGTGKESAFQPLSNFALLTKTSELKPLISVGAGIKFAPSRAFQIRAEVRDALTPFPKTVIAPANGAKMAGWLQDFVALIGLSFTF